MYCNKISMIIRGGHLRYWARYFGISALLQVVFFTAIQITAVFERIQKRKYWKLGGSLWFFSILSLLKGLSRHLKAFEGLCKHFEGLLKHLKFQSILRAGCLHFSFFFNTEYKLQNTKYKIPQFLEKYQDTKETKSVAALCRNTEIPQFFQIPCPPFVSMNFRKIFFFLRASVLLYGQIDAKFFFNQNWVGNSETRIIRKQIFGWKAEERTGEYWGECLFKKLFWLGEKLCKQNTINFYWYR